MIRRIVLASLLLILAPSAANAAMICVLSGTGVAFGQFSGSRLTSTGAIVVSCIGNGRADYELELSTGGSGTYDPRQMKKGAANTLSYNLYTDAAHSQIWGDGRHGTEVVSGRLNIDRQGFLTFSIPVYGKVPNQREPAPGNYSDTITATFDYDRKEATTSFSDTASVMPGCTISADDLHFFSYTGSQRDVSSEITVNCTDTTRWNVGLDPGTYRGATVTTRRMSGPVRHSFLSYGLYRNAAHTQNWGETIGRDTEEGTGTGSPQILRVYGQIPGLQNPAGGGYVDTITATLTF